MTLTSLAIILGFIMNISESVEAGPQFRALGDRPAGLRALVEDRIGAAGLCQSVSVGGGRFVVIRFSGVMDTKKADLHEAKAREWIAARGLEAEETAERAGYDAPYIPGFLRRNEVLIRLKATESDAAAASSDNAEP